MRPLLALALLLTAFTMKNSWPAIPGLTCNLAADKAVYKAGELPRLTVEISNNSKEDIYLVGSLDGSDVKWRFPHCYFSIERPVPGRSSVARCGNMNSLRPEDFRLVKAGQKFNPYQYGFFDDYMVINKETFKNPGVYRLRFYYSTRTDSISGFMGDRPFRTEPGDSLQMETRFSLVPRWSWQAMKS